MELELDEQQLRWKVTRYDDAGYTPWDGLPTEDMYRVIFENDEYHVPESEYLAHQDDYKAAKRKPPPPWDKPVR